MPSREPLVQSGGGQPGVDEVGAVGRREEPLAPVVDVDAVVVPAEPAAAAGGLDDAVGVGDGAERDLEEPRQERRAGLVGQRHGVLGGQRVAPRGRVVVDELTGGLGVEPLPGVRRTGAGVLGELLGGERPELGHRAVVAELVAEDDERGVQRRADLVDGAEDEGHESVLVDRCGGLAGHGLFPPGGPRSPRVSLVAMSAKPDRYTSISGTNTSGAVDPGAERGRSVRLLLGSRRSPRDHPVGGEPARRRSREARRAAPGEPLHPPGRADPCGNGARRARRRRPGAPRRRRPASRRDRSPATPAPAHGWLPHGPGHVRPAGARAAAPTTPRGVAGGRRRPRAGPAAPPAEARAGRRGGVRRRGRSVAAGPGRRAHADPAVQRPLPAARAADPSLGP